MIELTDALVLQAFGSFPGSDIFNDTFGYVAMMTFVVGGLGLMSGSMTIAAMAAYITFAYFAITVSGIPILYNLLVVTLVLMCLGLGFKLYRTEAWGQ